MELLKEYIDDMFGYWKVAEFLGNALKVIRDAPELGENDWNDDGKAIDITGTCWILNMLLIKFEEDFMDELPAGENHVFPLSKKAQMRVDEVTTKLDKIVESRPPYIDCMRGAGWRERALENVTKLYLRAWAKYVAAFFEAKACIDGYKDEINEVISRRTTPVGLESCAGFVERTDQVLQGKHREWAVYSVENYENLNIGE